MKKKMSKTNTTSDGNSFNLGNKIFIGFKSIDGFGIHILMSLGLQHKDETIKPISFSDIKLKSFYESANETKMHPISVFNKENVSFLVVNTEVEDEECIELLNELFKWIFENTSKDFIDNGRIILINSLKIKTKLKTEGPYIYLLNDENNKELNEYEKIPDDTSINDNLISSCIHFLKSYEIKSLLIFASGYKPMKFQDITFEPNTYYEICQLIKKIINKELSFNKVNYIIQTKKSDDDEEKEETVHYDNFYN